MSHYCSHVHVLAGLFALNRRMGFPGLNGAMARGVRAACGAANLTDPALLTSVDNTQLSQGCFTVELDEANGEMRFCSEREIFEYLVSTYCGEQPDGFLPAALGGLEYPSVLWQVVAFLFAGIGLVCVLWAWFFFACCKDPDGCERAPPPPS